MTPVVMLVVLPRAFCGFSRRSQLYITLLAKTKQKHAFSSRSAIVISVACYCTEEKLQRARDDLMEIFFESMTENKQIQIRQMISRS
ncbi:hypothetical protein T10_5438 [Trichinella papuae]|uniref:Uncharacterized protein n=1 Tax=Trichinella papuae TaxID=268474 RepID=A0A0V1N1N8_9BILA|nr:hypothetical protein T10_5438 [Trichinella papuae]